MANYSRSIFLLAMVSLQFSTASNVRTIAQDTLVQIEVPQEELRDDLPGTVNLPLNDKSYTPDMGYGGGSPVAMQACGNYVFVAYGYGLVRVHRLKNGAFVGTIRPNINGFKGSGGCVDSDNAFGST